MPLLVCVQEQAAEAMSARHTACTIKGMKGRLREQRPLPLAALQA